jgi:hypothetical protein
MCIDLFISAEVFNHYNGILDGQNKAAGSTAAEEMGYVLRPCKRVFMWAEC